MNHYLWPVLTFLCFLACLVTMPRGIPVESLWNLFEPTWLVFEGCIVAMLIFWCLWVCEGRWL